LVRRLKEKLEKVQQILSGKKVLVAFSGGVDSSVVTLLAKNFSSRVLAVTVVSEVNPPGELKDAEGVAEELGVEWSSIKIKELNTPEFRSNPPNRCYYCKRNIMSALREIALAEGMDFIIDGTNYDDLADYRPGTAALGEFQVKSPLAEAEITKKEIRAIASEYHLSVCDKPAMACLASRIPYGEEITEKKLMMISEAEKLISDLLRVRMVRVRHHGDIARIEVPSDERSKFLVEDKTEKIVKELRRLGFIYVVLDLQGYRSGSLNERLKKD
jgi:uncharacterized protein